MSSKNETTLISGGNVDQSSSSQYDEKGNAKHYNEDRIESIVKMERIWGTQAVAVWCEITEFKYRERMGKKEGQSLEQDLKKANWYSNMAKKLWLKVGTPEEIAELAPYQLKNHL